MEEFILVELNQEISDKIKNEITEIESSLKVHHHIQGIFLCWMIVSFGQGDVCEKIFIQLDRIIKGKL